MGRIGDTIDIYDPTNEEDGGEEELITKLNARLKRARDHSKEWRTWAQDAYDMYSGHQWSEEDKQKLDDEGRPAIVFNRVARNINFVIGEEVQNRQEVRYLAREQGDAHVNEILSQAAKWVRDQCDAEDEESEAFQDALITGLGCTETHLDFSSNPDGDVVVERTDPIEMLWDHNAKKRNLDDARWVARVKYFTKDEFAEDWPDFADQVSGGSFFLDTDKAEDTHNADKAWEYAIDQGSMINKENVISVVQMQWWEIEYIYRVETPAGVINLTSEQFHQRALDIKRMRLPYAKVPQKKYKQAIFSGSTMLDYSELEDGCFSFRFITGLRDRNKNLWFGLVRLMSDPQMWANKWLSQILHIVNSNAKGGLMYEEGAFTDPRSAQEEWAKPNGFIKLNSGGLAKVQQKEAPRYPDGVDRLLQYSLDAISDVPGINPEMLGQTNRNQPVGVESLRKSAGLTLLATFFDSLRRYRKEQGRVLAKLIVRYISDGRLIRIVGDEGAQYVPLMRVPQMLNYDVVVDDAPTSPNMKEKVFMVVSGLLPLLLQAGIPVPPEIIDYAPLPESLIEKWKAMLTAQMRDDQGKQIHQVMMMQKQLELEGMSEENKETASKTILNMAKAKEAASVAADESAQAQQKMGLDTLAQKAKTDLMKGQQATKVMEMLANQKRDNMKFALDQSRDEQKMQNDMQKNQMQLHHQQQMQAMSANNSQK